MSRSDKGNLPLNKQELAEYEQFKNSGWQHRRRITYLVVLGYLAGLAWIVVVKEPKDVQLYDGVVGQMTFVFMTVVGLYFGGSSYEATKIPISEQMKEFANLKTIGKQPADAADAKKENEVG